MAALAVLRITYSLRSSASCTITSAPRPMKTWRRIDRKSTRLNSSHGYISYAVLCLEKNDGLRQANCKEAMRARDRQAAAQEHGASSVSSRSKFCAVAAKNDSQEHTYQIQSQRNLPV